MKRRLAAIGLTPVVQTAPISSPAVFAQEAAPASRDTPSLACQTLQWSQGPLAEFYAIRRPIEDAMK
jgi:hypothetical protein